MKLNLHLINVTAIITLTIGVFYSCSDTVDTTGLDNVLSKDIPAENTPSIVVNGDKNITTNSGNFVDATGRTMLLRGINLGGSSKIPYTPNMGTHVKDGFYNGKEVSFVGRPFPLAEADEHFSRLKAWGFHFLRFLVTWEAIEHAGPGIYDEEYLDYIRAMVSKANDYGINVMIDPHQDVWSRYTGGDGAPLWTFEVAGMDVTKFQETGAAFVHNIYGDPFPRMIWYTNYYKLGAATMFTLFYGGNDFAPDLLVDSVNIQDYLQNHYIKSLMKVAEKVKDLPNVIGFELMNEPSSGYIGIDDITKPYNMDIVGDSPTPFEGMVMGAGESREIDHFEVGMFGLKSTGVIELNKNNASVWKDGDTGLWQKCGVWRKIQDGKPEVLNRSYFSTVNGKPVDVNKQYYTPFVQQFADSIRSIYPDWIICVGNILFPDPMPLPELKNIPDVKWINGSHWYDDITLFKKEYIPYLGYLDGEIILGKGKVKKAFVNYLAEMIDETHEKYGDVPSLLGEFGIPFDMNEGEAFKDGDYSDQIKALDRSFSVVEANHLNYTLWNYTADNTNSRGDLWNGEDLSAFSLSQQSNPVDINSGGRALEAAIRPYPRKIPGKLTEYKYDYQKKEMLIKFNSKSLTKYPAEIFIPDYIYGNSFEVYSTNGKLSFDKEERILMFYPSSKGEQTLVLKNKISDKE